VDKPTPLIASLHCPYCGSGFEEVLRLPNGNTHIPASGHYGVLQCGCAEYPVLDGIPVLQHVEGLQQIMQHVKQGNAHHALLQAMNVFRIKWAHRTRWHQARYYMNCRRLTTDAQLTFQDAVGLVRKPKGFADYLFHRYANPSFLSDMTLLPVVETFVRSRTTRARVKILDLACGAGHSSLLLTQSFPEVSVIAADQDFVSLYLARRFLAPGAEFVCYDVEAPSPFADDAFDVVHCLDAFHYFKSKRAVVAELERVAQPDALWLFPHLHNALVENVTAGIPLSVEGYFRCFERVNPTIVDEATLLDNRCGTRDADPFRQRPLSELSGAPTLALVSNAPTPPGNGTLYSWLRANRRNLGVNPIYRGEWAGETLRLEMQWPNEVLHRECRHVENILPKTLEVRREDLRSLLSEGEAVNDQLVLDLLCRFVIVPLAPQYSRSNLLASCA